MEDDELVPSPRARRRLEGRYRVEHREPGRASILARVIGVFAHHTTLCPYVSHLLMIGAGGEVVLIDEDSDAIVARRRLNRGPARGRTRGDAGRSPRFTG